MDQRIVELTPRVIRVINEELAYTATLSAQGRSDKVYYGVAGQILTLQSYARRANAVWVQNPGNNDALHELRKCASIAIRALILEGCPQRVAPETCSDEKVPAAEVAI